MHNLTLNVIYKILFRRERLRSRKTGSQYYRLHYILLYCFNITIFYSGDVIWHDVFNVGRTIKLIFWVASTCSILWTVQKRSYMQGKLDWHISVALLFKSTLLSKYLLLCFIMWQQCCILPLHFTNIFLSYHHNINWK